MTKQELFSQIDQTVLTAHQDVSLFFTEDTIKTLHKICCQKNADANAGNYRSEPAPSCGPGHVPPKPSQIPHFMEHFINQMVISRSMFHPIEFAAIAYKRLLDIYPFASCNEETASLFMNLLLAKEGYPLVFMPSACDEYKAAMAAARKMPYPDTDPLVLLVAKYIKKLEIV